MDEQGREAMRIYVAQRHPDLLRTAFLLTGSRADAEDLVQTALAKTWLSWDRIRDHGALDAYVRRTMVNTQTSWWRRRRVDARPTEHLPEGRDDRDEPGRIADHDALWTALQTLSTRQRAMVVLRYWDDLSEADTAAAVGVSVGTVKSTTSRALAALRSHPGLRDDDATAPDPTHPSRTPGARP